MSIEFLNFVIKEYKTKKILLLQDLFIISQSECLYDLRPIKVVQTMLIYHNIEQKELQVVFGILCYFFTKLHKEYRKSA